MITAFIEIQPIIAWALFVLFITWGPHYSLNNFSGIKLTFPKRDNCNYLPTAHFKELYPYFPANLIPEDGYVSFEDFVTFFLSQRTEKDNKHVLSVIKNLPSEKYFSFCKAIYKKTKIIKKDLRDAERDLNIFQFDESFAEMLQNFQRYHTEQALAKIFNITDAQIIPQTMVNAMRRIVQAGEAQIVSKMACFKLRIYSPLIRQLCKGNTRSLAGNQYTPNKSEFFELLNTFIPDDVPKIKDLLANNEGLYKQNFYYSSGLLLPYVMPGLLQIKNRFSEVVINSIISFGCALVLYIESHIPPAIYRMVFVTFFIDIWMLTVSSIVWWLKNACSKRSNPSGYTTELVNENNKVITELQDAVTGCMICTQFVHTSNMEEQAAAAYNYKTISEMSVARIPVTTICKLFTFCPVFYRYLFEFAVILGLPIIVSLLCLQTTLLQLIFTDVTILNLQALANSILTPNAITMWALYIIPVVNALYKSYRFHNAHSLLIANAAELLVNCIKCFVLFNYFVTATSTEDAYRLSTALVMFFKPFLSVFKNMLLCTADNLTGYEYYIKTTYERASYLSICSLIHFRQADINTNRERDYYNTPVY